VTVYGKTLAVFRQSNINEIADILDITEGEQPSIARDRRFWRRWQAGLVGAADHVRRRL